MATYVTHLEKQLEEERTARQRLEKELTDIKGLLQKMFSQTKNNSTISLI